jgi:hypothetical protein
MNPDELDRILSAEQEILPSSGFTASVMGAVRAEASAPPPIPFPWKRVLPGLVIAAVVLVVLLAQVIAQLKEGARATQSPWATLQTDLPILSTAQHLGAQWILFALVVTLGALWFPLRLAASDR